MTTPVIVKFPTEAKTINIDFVDQLIGGETISSGAVSASDPAGLTVSASAVVGSAIPLTVSGGVDAQSYGVNVTVNTTGGHTYVIRVAVVNNADLAANYQNVNVDAFSALVGELQAGEAAVGRASFMFPLDFDAQAGQVNWSLLDSDGVVLGQGTAYDYNITTLSSGIKIEADAVVSVPSDTLPTLEGQNYQIRWTLTIDGRTYHSFESLRVTAPTTVPQGVEDVVELVDHDIPVSVIFSKPMDTVTLEIYKDNTKVGSTLNISAGVKVADGWLYQKTLTGLELDVRLEPYTLLWSGRQTSSNYVERQTGRMFIVNPMILSASEDMRLLVNRSGTSMGNRRGILFTVPLLLAYMRRGRDAFNGAYGVMTAFTMLAASGPIREYWLKYSEIQALRSQYLAEGENVFNFSGQAISLEVDRTQFYDQAANQLQQQFDAEVKAFKTMLVKRGILQGDGNVFDLTKQRHGAAGAIGITITPASNFGPYARYRR